jgi:membrane protease YdiL (CAAX protease family)
VSFPPQTAPPSPPVAPPEQASDQSADGFPRWPLWGPFAALAIGLAFGILVAGIVTGVSGLDGDSPWTTSIGTVLVQICIVGAAIAVAGTRTPPRLWHFGIRRAPFGQSAGLVLAALALFYGFTAVYGAIVQPENPQTIIEDVGANESAALLLAGALMVIVVAPICEEVFFRGFLFRVLRVRMSFWPSAVIDGVVFGLVHGSLIIAPVLGVLGVLLCWVYERTGSLLPAIAVHVLNNTIVYGATTDDGWVAAGAVGAAMLVACATAPALLAPRAREQAV